MDFYSEYTDDYERCRFFLDYELKDYLVEKMLWYQHHGADFQSFVDELGWESWMNEFTNAAEGEPITEADANAIDKFLRDLWNQSIAGGIE